MGERIGPLLPAERGRGCRPAGDNRRYFEGMVWMARTEAQWRYLPDEYGNWNSVFRRCRRWVSTGVFDAMLETFAEMVERGTSADMIDSTVCGCPLSTMPRTAGIAECKSVCTLRLPPAETIGPVYRP